MKKNRIIFVLCIALFVFTGCTQWQLRRLDTASVTLADAGRFTETLLNSPAAAVIPPNLRLYISLGAAVMLAGANAWQSVRGKKTLHALQEVVVGNEAVKKGADFTDAQNTAQSVSTVKLVSNIRKKVTGLENN
jgi:hypothetical protein